MIQLPVFRFDDVCINTNLENLDQLMAIIFQNQPLATILLAISPVVFTNQQFQDFRPGQKQRVHPNELTAMSNYEVYYQGAKCGVPNTLIYYPSQYHNRTLRAGHGMAHVDHRLLGRKAQTMSILMSCALAHSSIFVPPYNKYNQKTEEICVANGIELVRWEDGWKHILYNTYNKDHQRYYLHPYDMTVAQLRDWFINHENLHSDPSAHTQTDHQAKVFPG